MSVSAIASGMTSSPVVSVSDGDTKTVAAQPSSDNDDASEALPAPKAPLPPGQGTRVDQLV